MLKTKLESQISPVVTDHEGTDDMIRNYLFFFFVVCLQDSSINREDFPYFRPVYTVCVIHLSRTSVFCLDIWVLVDVPFVCVED
jgi:hypothetical protein